MEPKPCIQNPSGKHKLTFCRYKVKEKKDFQKICFKFKEQLGLRICSPAKMIKMYLKDYVTVIKSELKKKKIRNLYDFILKEDNDFFEGEDYSDVFNHNFYSKVLNLYLVYFSLYKEYGFIIDNFGKNILQNIEKEFKINNCYLEYEDQPNDQLNCDYIYFDTTGYEKIKLEKEEQNIILLREIPFYIEDFFKEKEVSQEIIYMISFLYLYNLIDYEFILSDNKVRFKGEFFKISDLCKKIFRYILERNKRDCLKKYTVNEKIMNI